MKLVNRVSVFFLTALAAALVVYSSMFYAFVRSRLVQHFNQELRGPFNALVAAVEVEQEEVKWEPREHMIALEAGPGSAAVRWAVIGDRRRVVETSRNAPPEFIAEAQAIASHPPRKPGSEQSLVRGDWVLLHQRLIAPAPEYDARELDEFDEIEIVVAHNAAALNANLRRLLLLVCVLPVGTWLIAAGAGQWFCRRALRPVWEMSAQARGMIGAGVHSRLKAPATRDELADLAAAFNLLLDHRRRAFEQQQRFTGAAAHELRTPLTVLLGQIDVALRRERTPEEYAATLGVLREQTAQLQTIVEALLFLARSEEDAVLPDAETFSLAAWLPDYLHRFDDHPRGADIRLDIDTRGAIPIKASPTLLARLLDNLIENALKYSSPGTSVTLTAAADASAAVIEVEDQGRGIAAEDQAEIFRPFFRCRAAREAGIAGTGLGLAIAARIATACGGRLDCQSEIARGSRFTLRLPLAGGEPAFQAANADEADFMSSSRSL